MAVPTITSITPASGSTKGTNLVVVEGTNFRLPDPPPATGAVNGPAPLSVKVSFEGIDSEYAEAASDTKIYCRVPQWRGDYAATMPLALDVRVANVDAAGAEITGENVTAVGGYSVHRRNLAQESSLQLIIRELIKLFRRHLLENTHLSMSRDYDGMVLDFARKKPELPVVYLIGPRTPVDRFNSVNREDCEENGAPDLWLRKAIPIVTEVIFDIIVIADSQKHLFSLDEALMLMFRDVTEVVQGGKEYELRMPFASFPKATVIPNMSDVFNARASCTIKGVQLDDSDGTIIERGWITSANDGEPIIEVESIPIIEAI